MSAKRHTKYPVDMGGQDMPPLSPDPSVVETVGDIQCQSNAWVYTPELSAAQRREIARQGRRHARAGAVGLNEDGCAWGVYITACRNRCMHDINLNIRRFYAQTLPWVCRVITSAHNIAHFALPEPAAPQGDTWARQQERKRQSALQRRVEGLNGERADLEGYLASYRTALLELQRIAVSCQAMYYECASCYMDAAVCALRRPRILGGARIQFSREALEHLHFPEVEVELPTDAFDGMSGDELIDHAEELRLPAAYDEASPRAEA